MNLNLPTHITLPLPHTPPTNERTRHELMSDADVGTLACTLLPDGDSRRVDTRAEQTAYRPPRAVARMHHSPRWIKLARLTVNTKSYIGIEL